MKKIFLAVCALCALLVSCGGNAGEGTGKAKKVQQKSVRSLIIYSGWDLYEEHDDGKMYAVREAETGDAVSIYLNAENTVDQKTAVRRLSSGKEDELNFVHVLYEGEDYWTRDIFVSGIGGGDANNAATAAVILNDSFAYSAPNGASITSTQLKEGTVFAFVEDQAEGENGFFKAVIYNGTAFGKEIYIKDGTFSVRPEMLELVRTFDKLTKKPESEKDQIKPEVREELAAKMISAFNLGGTGSGECTLSVDGEKYCIAKLVKVSEAARASGNPLSDELEYIIGWIKDFNSDME